MTETGDKVDGDLPFILGFVIDGDERKLVENAGIAHSQVCLECIEVVGKSWNSLMASQCLN
jgi:hypothetical protein